MASTGKKYNVEVGVSVDRNSAKANVENALKAIKSKVSDIKLKFDVDTAKLKEVSETTRSLKQTFVDLDGNVASVTAKMSGNWADAIVSIKDNVKALKQETDAIKEQSGVVEKAGYSWSKAWEGATKYTLVMGSIVQVKNTVMDMVNSVISLDDSLVELQKVTDLEGDSLSKFVGEAYDAGAELAKTGQEMVDASTSFAKSGYDADTSLELGKVASMYTNIADEEIAAGDAANFIIAQLKAFKLEADDTNKTLENSYHIIDAVNEISNDYAVSSADIAKNLGISSSVMANAGNTLEETIGLNDRSIKTSLIDWEILRGLHTKLCW